MLWLVLKKHFVTCVFRAVLNCYLCYHEDSFVMMSFPLCIQFVALCRTLWRLCCIVTKPVLAEITRLVRCGSINTGRHLTYRSSSILKVAHWQWMYPEVLVGYWQATADVLQVMWHKVSGNCQQDQQLTSSCHHHVTHSSGPTQSRAMGGAEMSCIERGLATSNSTVMSESAIQQQLTELLQGGICQLCISAAAV